MNLLAVRLVAAAALLITGAWVSWLATAGYYTGQLSDLRRGYAEQRERSAILASVALQAAVQRGDQLAAAITAAETARQIEAQETTRAIHRLTIGRPCLGSAAVRLLNGPAGLKPALSEAPGQPVEPDAAFATDTDVGLWADAARRSYDTCRGRLQGVADFFEATHPHPGPPHVPGDTVPAGHKREGVQ